MEQSSNASEDVINLYDLYKIILKRKRIVVGLFLLFVLSAVIIGIIKPNIYRGEGVLIVLPAANLSAKELVDMIGDIDKDKKSKLLPTTADLVANIKLNTFKDSKDKIEVIIEAKDKNAILQAMSEMTAYLRTVDLVIINLKEEQEKLAKKSTELSLVVAASVELMKTYDHLLNSGKLVPVGFNPIELNKKISDIKLELFINEQTIRRLHGGVIEVAKQTYLKDQPINKHIIMNIGLAGMTSVFLGILLVFFLEYLEKMKNKSKS